VRAFAYLLGLCFPKERDATKNTGTLGFVTQKTGSFVEPMECLSVSKLPVSMRAA
jgi:hypothetical protein